MSRDRWLASILVAGAALAGPAAPAQPVVPQQAPSPGDHVVYEPKYEDPVLKELEDRDKAAAKAREEETEKIRAAQKARDEAEKKARKTLRADVSGVEKPAGPAAFKAAFHFPPVAQYLTGTCWSFATTSFFEAEAARRTGVHVKLSEMYSVYWEYVEKVRGWVRERGRKPFGEGSEANAFQRLWRAHGIVPAEAYPGVLAPDGRHDHARLDARLRALCAWAKSNDDWDEDLVVAMARAILDRELGPPPDRFKHAGRTWTPVEFLHRVLKIDPDDYVSLMSTLAQPFWQAGEFKVDDNWWHDASYQNVPLDDWYGALRGAVERGFTVVLGGDTSEPGHSGFQKVAIVSSFDVPQAGIDQDSRELRIDNHTTGDDHGIHAVGVARAGGHDWFLIKDSGRSARWAKPEGYYYFRDDFIRLKMLTILVHKDAVRDLLAKFPKPQP